MLGFSKLLTPPTPGADAFAEGFGKQGSTLHKAGKALEARYHRTLQSGGNLFTHDVVGAMGKVRSEDRALFRSMVSWMASSGQLPADQTYQVLQAVDQVLDLTSPQRADGGLVKGAIASTERATPAAIGFQAAGTQLHQDAATLELQYQKLVAARESGPTPAAGIMSMKEPFVPTDVAQRLAEDPNYELELKSMLAWMSGDLPAGFLNELFQTLDDAVHAVQPSALIQDLFSEKVSQQNASPWSF